MMNDSIMLDAFNEPIFECLSCGKYTSNDDEICELCEELGVSRGTLDAEGFFDDDDDDGDIYGYDDDGSLDFLEGYCDEY